MHPFKFAYFSFIIVSAKLLYLLTDRFFLLLSSTPMHYNLFNHSSIEGYLAIFQLETIKTKLPWTFACLFILVSAILLISKSLCCSLFLFITSFCFMCVVPSADINFNFKNVSSILYIFSVPYDFQRLFKTYQQFPQMCDEYWLFKCVMNI